MRSRARYFFFCNLCPSHFQPPKNPTLKYYSVTFPNTHITCVGINLTQKIGNPYLTLIRYWARLMLAADPVMVTCLSVDPSTGFAILICAPDIWRISLILAPWRPIMQPINLRKKNKAYQIKSCMARSPHSNPPLRLLYLQPTNMVFNSELNDS